MQQCNAENLQCSTRAPVARDLEVAADDLEVMTNDRKVVTDSLEVVTDVRKVVTDDREVVTGVVIGDQEVETDRPEDPGAEAAGREAGTDNREAGGGQRVRPGAPEAESEDRRVGIDDPAAGVEGLAAVAATQILALNLTDLLSSLNAQEAEEEERVAVNAGLEAISAVLVVGLVCDLPLGQSALGVHTLRRMRRAVAAVKADT